MNTDQTGHHQNTNKILRANKTAVITEDKEKVVLSSEMPPVIVRLSFLRKTILIPEY